MIGTGKTAFFRDIVIPVGNQEDMKVYYLESEKINSNFMSYQ